MIPGDKNDVIICSLYHVRPNGWQIIISTSDDHYVTDAYAHDPISEKLNIDYYKCHLLCNGIDGLRVVEIILKA